MAARALNAAGRYHACVKCDKCDNEATVHEVSIKGGKRDEKHLCEKCAREQGVNVVQPAPGVSTLMQTFIAVKGVSGGGAAGAAPGAGGEGAGAAPASVNSGACAACGQTFAQFRTAGVLGCPQCYSTFESQLTPLLSRAHEGGTHHVGKTPKSAMMLAGAPGAGPDRPAEPSAENQKRLAALRKALEEAIAGEQYEKAAKLRDELQRLQLMNSPIAKPADGEEEQPGEGEQARARARRRGSREDLA